MQVQNPILPGFYPDPSVVRLGEDYYLVNSSFEYFPGVPIFHSRDLVNWRQIGHCLTRATQLPLTVEADPNNFFATTPGFTAGIFAPTLRHHNGRFYMVTTNVTVGKHFYVYADDPAGEWSEPIWVDVSDIGWSIDPSLFFDDDGTAYFTCNGRAPQGIYQFVIDIETGHRLSDMHCIASAFVGKDVEGPHLFKKEGAYYLLTAEGGTEYGHLIAIGRSAAPWGPFEACPHNPILTHRSTDSAIQATGHGDLFQAHDGSWWIVFLGVRPNGYPPVYHLGRETFLAPVTWTPEGWPVVGDNGRASMTFAAPAFAAPVPPPTSQRDEFTDNSLGLDWNFLRNPAPDSWSLRQRPGWLYLRNTGGSTLDDRAGAPAFIGQRQRHFCVSVETLVDVEQGEAGLTVLMNERHHYEIALTDAKEVIVRRRIGDLVAVTARHKVDSTAVRLGIRADHDTYIFSLISEGHALPLATGETRYLSTEVAGGFIGVYFGLYATHTAFFDYFEYRPD